MVAATDDKAVDESTVWTIREDLTPSSSNRVPVPFKDSKAVAKDTTKIADSSCGKNAFADWVDGGEYIHVHEGDADVLKLPLAEIDISPVDTSHKSDVGKDRVGTELGEKVESIANIKDKEIEGDRKETVSINQNKHMD